VNAVHLYLLPLADDPPGRRARCEALLSDEERARRDRFLFERNQLEYLHGHALVRLALSHHAPEVAPAAWRFTEGPHGRPEIAGPSGAPSLVFNLTHTTSLVAVVVGRGCEVGVDAEDGARDHNTAGVAERFFAPVETARLRALPPPEQPERFLTYWTLKESYIKARGLGLACPLDAFWFDLDGDAPAIHFAPPIDDRPERWRFVRRRVGARHLVAVAVGSLGDAPPPPVVDGAPLLEGAP
jgi:4'-phosphopantetheinyl transferase